MLESASHDGNLGDLLARAQRGDAVAYDNFLRAIVPFARALTRRRVGSHDGVEDVVQDVLLTIHRVRHTYQPGRPVEPWVAAIVGRRSIDHLRKRGRTAANETHNPVALETFTGCQANSNEDTMAGPALARGIEELAPKQKEAIELVKLKELSMAEASAISGQSVASLKVNVHRALKSLRRSLGRGEFQ